MSVYDFNAYNLCLVVFSLYVREKHLLYEIYIRKFMKNRNNNNIFLKRKKHGTLLAHTADCSIAIL